MSEAYFQIDNYKLKRTGILETGHTSTISQISIFPSKKYYISVSYDKSIIIWNEDNSISQKINDAHEREISYVCIKDDDNFATSSYDDSIKFWKKDENEFKLDKTIPHAHKESIHKILFQSNNNLISCSSDYSLKIWKLNNDNNYINIKTLYHEEEIYSFLIIEDKNLLISSGVGDDKTIFWDLETYDKISELNKITSYTANSMLRITENIIVIGEEDGYKLRFIDIDKKQKIKQINTKFYNFGMYLLQDKGIFLVGGFNGIKIYTIDDFKKIQFVKNAENNDINGFFEMKNNVIGTFGDNGKIQTWEFQLKNEEDDKNDDRNSDDDDEDDENIGSSDEENED